MGRATNPTIAPVANDTSRDLFRAVFGTKRGAARNGLSMSEEHLALKYGPGWGAAMAVAQEIAQWTPEDDAYLDQLTGLWPSREIQNTADMLLAKRKAQYKALLRYLSDVVQNPSDNAPDNRSLAAQYAAMCLAGYDGNLFSLDLTARLLAPYKAIQAHRHRPTEIETF